jgi:hypothetical protein
MRCSQAIINYKTTKEYMAVRRASVNGVHGTENQHSKNSVSKKGESQFDFASIMLSQV